MFKKCLLILSLGLLSGLNLKAEVPALNQYYENVYMGEQKTTLYFGPLDQRSTFHDKTGELVFLDTLFRRNYLNHQIQDEAFGLNKFWVDDVLEKSTCPNEVLSANIDYIRYLYRLVSISYLFESLKLTNKLSVQLGSQNNCSISYKTLFEKCSAKSEDMKKFKTRVYGKFVNEISKIKIEPFSKKEKSLWLEDFQKSTSLSSEPIESRMHEWCIANKKSCRSLNENEIKSALSNFCSDDSEMITKICSEKDELYGFKKIKEATELIKISNAFNLINRSGMGEQCLRRFSKLFYSKEIPYFGFYKIYPMIFSYLQKINYPYPQGELFLPGALKEFDNKGLGDFLTALKPPSEPEVVIPRPKPKKTPPKVVIAPEPVIVKPVEQPVVKPAEPVAPKLSEFETRAQEITAKGLAEANVDMDTFRDDFEFSPEMINELATPIKKFQTRSALNDMKSYDLLGSRTAPVGLVFLKYMLDTDNHQGLYNVIAVLGEKFYVVNDIEKKDVPLFMHLKNDASTKNRWQIVLLKDPVKK
jgi:hypothetical protein